jgi:hypothetical protein
MAARKCVAASLTEQEGVFGISGRTPVIGITLIRISHSGDERVVTESFGFGNSLLLPLVVYIGHARSVSVF